MLLTPTLNQEEAKRLRTLLNRNERKEYTEILDKIITQFEKAILENQVDISSTVSCNLDEIRYSWGDVLRGEIRLLKYLKNPAGNGETKVA